MRQLDLGTPSLAEADGLAAGRIAASSDEAILRILVVEAETGRPVPGARVLLQKENVDPIEWDEAWERWNDLEPMLAQGLGQAFVSDPRGIACVPRPNRRAWVTADLGQLHGECRADPNEDLCRLEMRAYHSLAIEVLDPLGRPAEDVRIALMESKHGESWSAWSGITGREGRIEIFKLEEKLRDENAPLVLGPCLAVATPLQLEFTAATAPVGPVRFVLGPTGIVEVIMSDAGGRTLDVRGTLGLEIVSSELPALLTESGPHTFLVHAGSAVLDHVALGFEFQVQSYVLGKRFRERTFAGPVTPGERVRVYVPLEKTGTILRGRALNERGEPLRGVAIAGEALIPACSYRDSRFTARTDALGRFEGDILAPLPIEGRVSLSLVAIGVGSPHRKADLMLTLPEDSTQVELGDVAFLPLQVLVRGMVIDDGGSPVSNAWIDARDPVTRQELADAAWPSRIRCDSDGRFVVASSLQPAEIELTAHGWDRLSPEPTRVPLGSEDVVITLPRGGRLEGRALVPAGFGGEVLDFEFECARDRRTASWECFSDGTFEVPAAEPGLMIARISYCDSTLWERTDIEIRAGETTRLGEIDLRGRLSSIEIDIVDETGRPAQRGRLCWGVSPEADEFEEIEIPRSNPIRILSTQPYVNVLVRALGFRNERFNGVRDGDRLVLRAGIPVRLSLPANLPAVAPPLALHLIWDGQGESDVEGAPAGDDGIVLVRVPGPGSYEFSWILTHTLTGSQYSGEGDDQTVDVPESGVTTPVPFLLDPADVFRALERARGDD